jgi:hypothetical protein
MFASRPAHPSAAYLLRPCLVVAAAVPAAARGADSLPDPHGKLADLAKPVTVFILMGQSNMLGFGKIAGADKEGTLEHATKTAGLYPYLVDDAGNWTTRNDIRKVRVMVGRGGGMGVHANDWLSIKGKAIGPEVGIGHELGHLLEPDVHLDRIGAGGHERLHHHGHVLEPVEKGIFVEHAVVDGDVEAAAVGGEEAVEANLVTAEAHRCSGARLGWRRAALKLTQ